MILDRKEKQPVEVKDYPIDYSEWLAPGDTLINAQATVECLTNALDTALVVSSMSVSPTSAAPWLSGGTNGERYKVSVTVTTQQGRIDQSEFIVKIREY